jgi:hypothetical protein
MKVVQFEPKVEKASKKMKDDLLEVLDVLRKKIENDEVTEYIISSMHVDGEVEVYVCAKDFVGAIGLLESGKYNLFTQYE